MIFRREVREATYTDFFDRPARLRLAGHLLGALGLSLFRVLLLQIPEWMLNSSRENLEILQIVLDQLVIEHTKKPFKTPGAGSKARTASRRISAGWANSLHFPIVYPSLSLVKIWRWACSLSSRLIKRMEKWRELTQPVASRRISGA